MTRRTSDSAPRPLKVGIVCPYAWDVPGGVGAHIRDLAEHLLENGTPDGRPVEVSVIAPASKGAELPGYVVSAGKPVNVRYNGSVARLAVSPASQLRLRRWLDRGDFDVVHVHEPMNPSLSLATCLMSRPPVVGTFHSSNSHSRAMELASPLLQPALDRMGARIAVSEDAHRTMADHLGGEARTIPNGVAVAPFAFASPHPDWEGQDASSGKKPPTLGFVGRIDEPRKGLATLLEAFPEIARANPGVRLLVAGRGDASSLLAKLPAQLHGQVVLLGQVSDAEKAQLLKSVDAYIAPNTGGESFGIILTEAMSAGAPVLASNLGAFRRVLDDGRAGELFENGDAGSLAAKANALLADGERRAQLRSTGSEWVKQFDWSTVAADITAVYDEVIETAGPRR